MSQEFGIMAHDYIVEVPEREVQLRAIGPSGFLAALRSLVDGYPHTSVESLADIVGNLSEPIPRVVVPVKDRKQHPFIKRQIVAAFMVSQLRRSLRIV